MILPSPVTVWLQRRAFRVGPIYNSHLYALVEWWCFVSTNLATQRRHLGNSKPQRHLPWRVAIQWAGEFGEAHYRVRCLSHSAWQRSTTAPCRDQIPNNSLGSTVTQGGVTNRHCYLSWGCKVSKSILSKGPVYLCTLRKFIYQEYSPLAPPTNSSSTSRL